MGYSRILDTLKNTRRGKFVLVSWGGVLIACSLYGFLRTKKKRKKKSHFKQNEIKEKPEKKSFLKLAKQGFNSSTWLKAAALIASLSLRSVVNSHVNDQIGTLGEFTVRGDWNIVYQECVYYSIWGFGSAVLQALSVYHKDSLAADVRLNLSEKFQQRLEGINLVSIKNGSGMQTSWSRILCHDVLQFSDKTAELFFSLMKPLIEISWYTHKLANRIGTSHLAFCFSYFIIAHYWTKFALPSKKDLNLSIELAEDEFFDEHNRVCDFCEQIEFLRGRQYEIERLAKSSKDLSNARFALRVHHFLSDTFTTYFQKYGGVLVCFLSMVPTLQSAANPTEIFLQTLHDLVNLGLGFRDAFVALKSLDSIKVISDRIYDLEESIYAAEIKERIWRGEIAMRSKLEISATSLEISTPQKELLLTCDFNIRVGEKILILGKNGTGKSSLFRVLSGLWKRRSGDFTLPEDAYFLPQKHYLVQNLTVRDQLQYPSVAIDPKQLELAMEIMGFRKAIDSELDEVLDWSSLSPGQQQIVALTRVIAHSPSTLFLDEPTSALNASVTERFFGWISLQSITLITISHDESLRQFHSRVLEVENKTLTDRSMEDEKLQGL